MLASAPIMAATGTLVRIGLAQIDGRLGDVEGNVERHLDWIARAREADVDLLLFPELSLTGYHLLHLTSRVALPPGSPVLARLAQAAGPMRVVLGFVEESETGVLYNSAAVLSAGEPVFVHRKLYLPTYGIFQDSRFFGEGRRLETVDLPWGKAGVLICEDLWHPELARRLAATGVRLLLVISAAPGRVGAQDVPESHETWELLTRSTAVLNTCWVAYCNRVGWEEGAFYPGVSHVVRPGGEVVQRAPVLEEHLQVTEIDLRDADRLRWRLPLLHNERFDIEGPKA